MPIHRALLVGLLVSSSQLLGSPPSSRSAALRFEPAAGVAATANSYRARGLKYDLHVESTRFRLGLAKPDPSSLNTKEIDVLSPPDPSHAITVRFLGAAAPSQGEGRQPLSSHSNYLVGRDPANWRAHVPHFGRVHFSETYPGIDITYYSSNGLFEFDFLVAPGADPEQICMRFDGVVDLRLTPAGDLVITTLEGEITQRKPRVFQTIDGERRSIEGGYILSDTHEVRFALDPYDEDLPLVIDPVVDWATFLGGAGQDQANAVAVDAAGFVYVAGFTSSANFPTADPRDGDLSGDLDGFLSKLSPDGSELVWSTFLGGSLRDEIRGLQLDAEGNIYVSGATESADFPTTNGASQEALGGAIDAFVSKLSPDGSTFVYSTLFGGSDVENGRKLAVDGAGAAYVVGEVSGTAFPATPGAFQTQTGGGFDAFVAKISSSGSAVEWATYFGGNGTDLTFDIQADPAGGAVLAGATNSTDFPGTANAFQQTFAGTQDGFIAHFSGDGATADYFTYVGGTGSDQVRGISLDGQGNVWVAGGTASTDLPTTPNAPNPGFLGGSTDGFLARLPLPSSTVPGPPVIEPLVSYVGDELQNYGLAIAFPSGASAALVEEGHSKAFGEFLFYSLSNFTPTPIVRDGQSLDGSFGTVTEYDSTGAPIATTTIGGADGGALATDPSGRIVIVAGIGTPIATPTPGALQQTHGGGTGSLLADGFVAKIVTDTSGAMFEIEKTIFRPLTTSTVPSLPVGTRSKIQFDVRVTNVGDEPATGVVITDTGVNLEVLRVSGIFLTRQSHRPDCPVTKAPEGDTITCRLDTLPPGGRVGFTVEASPNTEGEMRNILDAAADNAAPVQAVVGRDVADTMLAVTKELIEPAPGEVTAGEPIRHRITVTNVGPNDAVDVLLIDFPDYAVDDVDVDPANSLGVSCSINTRLGIPTPFGTIGAVGISANCKRGLLSPGDSFSVVVSGRARSNASTADNTAQVEALNAARVVARSSLPVGEAAPSEEIRCEVRCRARGGSELPLDYLCPAVLGRNGKDTPVPDLHAQCWVRDQPTDDQASTSMTLDLNAEVANRVNPDGSLQGASLEIEQGSGEPVNLPLFAGEAPGTVRTGDYVSTVINNTLGAVFRGLQIDTTGLGDTFDLTQDYLVNSGVIPNGPHSFNKTTRFAIRNEVFTATFSEPGPDGSVQISLSLIETYPRAWSRGEGQTPNRMVTTISGLPEGASAGLMPACISSVSDETVELRRVNGADRNGAGGSTGSCADFTPTVTGGSITETFEISGAEFTGLATLRGFVLPYVMKGIDSSQSGLTVQAGLGPYLPAGGDAASLPAPLYRPPAAVVFNLLGENQAVIAPDGVVNAAGGAQLGYGLGSAYGQNMAGADGFASQVPLPFEIGGVQLFVAPALPEDFSGLTPEPKSTGPGKADLEAGAFAPLLFVSPLQINFQLPWELDLSSGFMNLWVLRNGQASQPRRVPVNPFSPGIFSFDFGPGRGIVTNLDATVAQPVGGVDDYGLTARPARVGDFIVILATGLGPVNPPTVTGDNSLDENGNFVQRDVVEPVRVFIGGVEATVRFAGLSPEFVGVYQLNVEIAPGTPVGDEVSIVIEIGGVRSREDVTIAVAP